MAHENGWEENEGGPIQCKGCRHRLDTGDLCLRWKGSLYCEDCASGILADEDLTYKG